MPVSTSLGGINVVPVRPPKAQTNDTHVEKASYDKLMSLACAVILIASGLFVGFWTSYQ